MSATDAMLSRFQAELEERRTFMDGLVEGAESQGRDLTAEEMDLYTRARDRMQVIESQMVPLREGARIAIESRRRTDELIGAYANARNPEHAAVEYRTAGAYVAEMYYAQLGDESARNRLDAYHRVAAHQTTADNPGLIPESIVSPLVNFIEVARPLTATLGPVDLGSGAWSYARVTQHTQVGKQLGEKTELPSRKMLVTKTPLGADTFGGYVNISKQDINRTSPAILDMVINDLAQQYAIETEDEVGTVLWAAATAGPIIPTGPATALAIAQAIWAAAGLGVRRHEGAGPHGRRGGARHARPGRADLPADQPDQRILVGVQRRRSVAGRQGVDRRPHGDHVGRSRRRPDPRLLDGGGQGVRVQVRQPAGRRAVGVGRAGRLRR